LLVAVRLLLVLLHVLRAVMEERQLGDQSLQENTQRPATNRTKLSSNTNNSPWSAKKSASRSELC